ncbi:MAG: NAD-dependent glyceraldehyde-3-phosphate dehydrogenase, partial [uncultured Friedmanniella sp.]
DRSCGHQRLRPHRPQLLPGRAGLRCRRRGGRVQRPRLRRHPGTSAQVRHDPGSPRPAGVGRRRRHPGGRQGHQVLRREGPLRPSVGRDRRRRRHRVDRLLHRRHQGQGPPRRRRQEGHHLRAGQERRLHRRHGRQRRGLRPGRAPHHLQRLLHHELPGADGQGPQRRVR